MLRFLFLAVALMLASLPIAADAPENIGPGIGSQLPHALTTLDSTGTAQSFDVLKGSNGAVLVFYRSAKWCPYCQRQLIAINEISDTASELGYPVIAISYDAPEVLAAFKARRGIQFPLLSDTDSAIIDAFGIRNPEYPADHYAHGVPYPLIAIVDATGTIRGKLFESSYKDRPQNDAILEAIKAAMSMSDTSR